MDPALRERWGAALDADRWALTLRQTGRGERMLDFGCGRGAYVEALNRHGREVFGVDIHAYDEWRACARRLGRSISDTFAIASEPLPFAENAFQVALAFEVVEHCADPIGVLRELRRVTSRDLLVSVPDCALDDGLRRHSLARAHWTDLTHVNFFTRESLDVTLRDSGWIPVWHGAAYRIDLNACFWDHVRLPRMVRRMASGVFRRLRLAPLLHSALLVHARKAP